MARSALTPRHDQMIWREIAVTMTGSKDLALLAYANITKFLIGAVGKQQYIVYRSQLGPQLCVYNRLRQQT